MRRFIALAVSCLPILQAFFYRAGLPEMLASNFDGAGRAGGFMPRDSYLLLMIVIGLGAWLLHLAIAFLIRRPDPQWVNLPHREFWFAPERRAVTIERLEFRMLVLHIGLMMFLCFVNYLVLEANLDPVPQLSGSFLVALVGFLALTVVWVVWLLISFRKPSSSSNADPSSSLDPR